MGTYVFKWPYPAGDVHVTGDFDDWGKTEQLNKVGDHWEKEVSLPSADKRIHYKFVVDDQWIIDDAAPKEDDGHWNVNNYILPEQIKRKEKVVPTPATHTPAAAAASTHETSTAPIERTTSSGSIPGAFPETPAHEPDSFGVAPFPATGHKSIDSSVTTSKNDYENAGSSAFPNKSSEEPPAFGVAPIPATGQKSIDSSVTTSKDDYENAGSAAFPNKSTEEPPAFGVAPIPATGQKSIDSSVTTSKDDYENAGSTAFPNKSTEEPAFGVKPIPASDGISNPISLPAGEKIPDQSEITPHTADSTVTTSKEAYENSGSGAFPAAAGAVGAAGLVGGLATASAFALPKEKHNLIPESSLPMGMGSTNTLDAGPFISSAGPGTTTADLAAKVPLEKKRQAMVIDPEQAAPFISSAGPGTTTSDLAAKVPLEPKTQARDVKPEEAAPFISSAGPGTTTSDLAAKVPLEPKRQAMVVDPVDAPALPTPGSPVYDEKAAVKQELQSKIEPVEAKGTSAKAAVGQTSYYGLATAVPSAVEESMVKAHASPEAATEPSVVAEKSAFEKELLSKVPTTNAGGEPAPTVTAATSAVAPGDSRTAKVPGTASTAAAQVSDGVAGTETPSLIAPKTSVPLEKSEGAATEYAPLRSEGAIPGVSSSAAAALSDGTEDPSLEHEPAVQMMHQHANDLEGTSTKATTDAPAGATSGTIHDAITRGVTGATTGPTSTTTAAAATPVPTSIDGKTDVPAGATRSTIHDAITTPSKGATTGAFSTPTKEGTSGAFSTPTKEATSAKTTTAAASTPAVPTSTDGQTDAPAGVKSSTVHDVITGGSKDATGKPSAAMAAATSAVASSSSKLPETPKKTTSSGVAPSTPASTPGRKPNDSVTSSPAGSTATDKKKKKHRLSTFIKKIFD